MPFCRECGKEVQPDWVTCPYCSAPQLHQNESKHHDILSRQLPVQEISDTLVEDNLSTNQMSVSVSDSVVLGDIIQNNSDPEEVDRIIRLREIEQFSKQLIDIFNRRKWQDAYSVINQISHSEPSIFSLSQEGFSEISNGSKLYGMVQQWRYILHQKRIETYSHEYITEFVRDRRIERGWGVNLMNDFDHHPLKIYKGDYYEFGLTELEGCISYMIEELEHIYKIRSIIEPMYNDITEHYSRSYLVTDIIRLKVNSYWGVDGNKAIFMINNDCIPFFKTLDTEQKYSSSGKLNGDCKKVLSAMEQHIDDPWYVFTKFLTTMILISIPLFLFAIYKWFSELSNDSNYVDGTYSMDPGLMAIFIFSFFGLILGIAFINSTGHILREIHILSAWLRSVQEPSPTNLLSSPIESSIQSPSLPQVENMVQNNRGYVVTPSTSGEPVLPPLPEPGEISLPNAPPPPSWWDSGKSR